MDGFYRSGRVRASGQGFLTGYLSLSAGFFLCGGCSCSMAVVMGVAARRLHAAAQAPRLKKLALHAPKSVIFGRRHVGIMSAESVGNYGVRILFDDLHKTGIFAWDYLHHLGSNKFSLMQNYIRTLRKHGLSRDPQKRK